MGKNVRVVVDAMGGDHAPGEIVKGALESLKATKDLTLIFVGQQKPLETELKKYQYDKSRVETVFASEVIEMAEPPVIAIRKKKDSSISVGLHIVKRGEADAFVSSGSTGAVLAGGQLIVGRKKGVERPPLAPMVPTSKGAFLLIDCGANVDARASQLVQFAKMGAIYMEYVAGVKNPRIGLVNIGEEEEKGNALVKETLPLLKQCSDLNFIGSVEARDIPYGVCDVAVCEAFVGNVILKLYEGTSAMFLQEIKKTFLSSLRTKAGAVLLKPALKQTLKKFDASRYGGAPMLGLNGLVYKMHGSAKAKEVRNSIIQCVNFTKQDMVEKIGQKIAAQAEE